MSQNFASLDNENALSSDESDSMNKKRYYVFTGKYLDTVESNLKSIGLELSKQSDPDRPRSHFPSGYLPAANKTDNNTSGKKAAHELRGVLLTVLCFLLSHSQSAELEKRIGSKRLADFILVFELTILLECWLSQDQYTDDELCLAEKFLPLFTNLFISTIDRTEGNGSKLVKIHLLHHFIPSIRLFGRASNFHGGTGESHLKPIKDHARRTKFQSHDYEYRTMIKHWEAGIVHTASLEVLSLKPHSLIAKHIASLKTGGDNNNNTTTRFGSRIPFTVTNGSVQFDILNNANKWSSSIDQECLILLLQKLGTCKGFIHTEYNVNQFKYHGNFYQQWEDWCF
ncbi:MAG TPA: hypothetical protein VIQ31_01105, partial [Phormidium sp.]